MVKAEKESLYTGESQRGRELRVKERQRMISPPNGPTADAILPLADKRMKVKASRQIAWYRRKEKTMMLKQTKVRRGEGRKTRRRKEILQ
jgi:hypothetical protein